MSIGTTAATLAATGARRRLKLLMIVMIIFLSWAAYTLADQYGQLSERRSELREADRRLTDARGKNEALQLEIDRLNDPEYIGQIARKEQGMGLPGERPIQIEKSSPTEP